MAEPLYTEADFNALLMEIADVLDAHQPDAALHLLRSVLEDIDPSQRLRFMRELDAEVASRHVSR